ncbi:unnamed protein product [Heterobilharzia americana]|nr:unnamed protein product [Heterobilharzia americana]
MVELLAIASGANLASAERYISWVLGVYSNNETGSSLAQTVKQFSTQTKEGNIPMGGTLAQSLISFGIVPASRLAKLRARHVQPDFIEDHANKSESDVICQVNQLPAQSNKIRLAHQSENSIGTNEDSVVDENNNNTLSVNGSEEVIEDALSPKYLTPGTRFKLLVTLTQLALDRDLLHVCHKCIKQCEIILKKEKLSNQESAALMLQFISLEIDTQKIAVKLSRMSSQYLTVHYHAMQKCHNLLEKCLINPSYQPEMITQGCLTLWRLCSPLLQRDTQTRLKTSKSLQLIMII